MIEKIYVANKKYCVFRPFYGIYKAEGGVPRMNTKNKQEQKKSQQTKANSERKPKSPQRPHEHERLETRMFD
jgi:hypothetical protein